MTVVGRGTFRVRSHNFSFVSPNVQEIYDHSIDMWNAKISWDSIKARFKSRGGSKKGAQTIQTGLNLLNDISLYTGDDRLIWEEKQILLDILKDTRGKEGESFFQFSKGLKKRERGDLFEDRVAELLERLLFSSDQQVQYNVGKELTRAPQQGTFIIDTTNVKSSGPKALQDAIMAQASAQYQDLVRGGEGILVKNFGEKRTPVIWRTEAKQGKVDTRAEFGNVDIQIQAGLSPEIEAMAQEIIGHNLSLKNYLGQTLQGYEENTVHWGGVSLGWAKTPMRAFGSFYYGVTGDSSFINACTFIYASMNSSNEVVQRYMSWARFVYELSGIGLVDMLNKTTGQLVDYLVINNADTGEVRVFWVGALIENMPDGAPPYEERRVSFGKGKGITHIFDFSKIS